MRKGLSSYHASRITHHASRITLFSMDLDRVEQLVRLFGGSRAHELVVEADGWHVSLRRGSGPAAVTPAGSPPEASALGLAEEGSAPLTVTITAPLVGSFRQGGRPLAVGARVRT